MKTYWNPWAVPFVLIIFAYYATFCKKRLEKSIQLYTTTKKRTGATVP